MVEVNKNQSEQKASPEVEDIFDFEKSPDARPTPEVQQPPEQQREAERQPETRPEQVGEQRTEDEQSRRQAAPPAIQNQPAAPAPVAKDSILIEIENVLSEHLEEIFAGMTPQQQMAFQQKGEETAREVKTLLQETKVKVREILNLIKEWLQMIPGVNKFFLEQEAKIKTDRLLNWREQQQPKQ